MKKLGVLLALCLLALPVAAADSVDVAGADLGPGPDLVSGPVWAAPEGGTVLVDNGPLVNGVGTGAGGLDESILQSVTLGMNILGFGHQQAGGTNRIADDFTVTGAGWNIDTCAFFAYQTGATTGASTMTGVTLRIWDGVPGSVGASVIFGDATTNVMSASAFTNIFRVSETTGGASNRPIFAQEVSLGGLNLGPGTYWLDWATDGSLASGPWAPPITIAGNDTTGDAVRTTDGGVTWVPAIDDDGFGVGSLTPQGFPFVCVGEQVTGPGSGGAFDPAVPTLGTVGLALLFLVLAAAAIFLLRRRRA
jgi:hypothetical protein